MGIAIGLIIIGLAKILFPKYVRFYKASEFFEKNVERSKLVIGIEKFIGFLFIAIGIIMLFYKLNVMESIFDYF